jgi:ribokinase
MPRICVVGSLNMDLVVQTPVLPAPGETVLGGPFATFPGGKGANQAVAAARAGARVTMVGAVGEDSYGEALRAGLEREGIESREVLRRTGVSSGVALIAVAPDGQNTIIVASGANASLTVEDIDHAAEVITAADVLLLQLEVPVPAIVRAAEHARAASTRVVLNPAPAQPLPHAVLASVDFVVPNETEVAALTGVMPGDWPSAEVAAQRLVDAGAQSVLLTLGSRGALLWHNGQVHRQPAFNVHAVDATAAGDAFLGAFAVALAEGQPAPEAMRWGAAAGALATTVPGAQPSLPARDAILALLATAPPWTVEHQSLCPDHVRPRRERM